MRKKSVSDVAGWAYKINQLKILEKSYFKQNDCLIKLHFTNEPKVMYLALGSLVKKFVKILLIVINLNAVECLILSIILLLLRLMKESLCPLHGSFLLEQS